VAHGRVARSDLGGSFVYLSAQNDGDGSVHRDIIENGRTISSNAATGECRIAQCDNTH
jgi:hypothetical protein